MSHRPPAARPSRPRADGSIGVLPVARKHAERAIDANKRVCSAADRLLEELDEVTAPHGIPVTGLSDEDSLVIAIADVRAAGAARS